MIDYIEFGNETLTSHSGLSLVDELVHRTNIVNRLDAIGFQKSLEPTIPNSAVVLSMVGLLCLGKSDYDAIEDFRGDIFFKSALEIKTIPSSPTLRQRLDLGAQSFLPVSDEMSIELLQRVNPDYGKIQTSQGEMIPLDADVSCHDNSGTKKEGVSYTYKKFNGYSPMYIYMGRHGFLLGCEFREGSAHSQHGTPEFLRQILPEACRLTNTPLLLRMDAGNDSQANLGICFDHDVHFVIKRNHRSEDMDQWIQLAEAEGESEKVHEGKVVYRGSCYRELSLNRIMDGQPVTHRQMVRVVYEVTERTIKNGTPCLFPDYEVSTWWTDLTVPAKEVIALYCDHGTSEQFHSEIKSDMGLERFPSGKFATNALILSLAKLSFNLLRICGQQSLRVMSELDKNGSTPEKPSKSNGSKTVQRRRLRTVIQDMMYVAGRVIRSARRLRLSLGKESDAKQVWMLVRQSLRSFPQPA